MAKSEKPKGRIRQLIDVYKMTIRVDKAAIGWALLGFTIPTLVGVLAGIVIGNGDGLTIAIWTITGALAGFLVSLIVMGRRAERAAFSQIEGKPGAVGAVLANALRRGWRSSEMPVAVNPRTSDAVYRAVGPAGIVLIGEGSPTRAQVLLNDEKRKLNRVVPGVPIIVLNVTGTEDSTPLHRLTYAIYKQKRVLNRLELRTVNARLQSLGTALPIPKGIDPTRKLRAPRR